MAGKRASDYRMVLLAAALCTAATVATAGPTGYDGPIPYTAGAAPTGPSYLLTDHWGGTFHDAEKTVANTEDDRLCWAATAANILAWTGWGRVDDGTGHVMTTADEILAYFADHWTDQGGLMQYGWGWWFDGTNDSEGWTGWARPDTPGGAFYGDLDPDRYIITSEDKPAAMTTIDTLLRAGAGVGVAINRPNPNGGAYGHAVTVWGVAADVDNPGDYLGLWITDSDDDKYVANASDRLRYYDVELTDGKWALQDYGGGDSWHIAAVEALAVPEPASALLMIAGASLLARRRRKMEQTS